MSSNRTPNQIRGFGIPFDFTSSNIWTSEASYSEQSPRAGQADPQQSSGMTITTRGTQSDAADITISTARGGSTNQNSGRAASFKWSVTGEPDNGFDFPVSIADYQIIQQELGGSFEWRDPHVISLSSGRLLVAAQLNSGLLRQVVIYRKDPGSSFSSAVVIGTFSSTILNVDYHPALIELPNGDILCCYYVSLGSSEDAQIRVYRSTDSGESFSLANDEALDTPINISTGVSNPGVTLKRMILAASQNTVLLLARGIYNNTGASIRERVIQAASSNLGASFKLVTQSVSITTGPLCLIGLYVDNNGAFNAAFIINDSRAALYKLPHAYFNLDDVSSINGNDIYNGGVNIVTRTSNAFVDGDEACLWVDDVGNLFALLKNIGQADGSYFIRASEDEGASFNFIQNKADSTAAADIPPLFRFGAASTTIKELSICSIEGRSILVSTFESSAGTYDDSLISFYLGGYSTITLPSSDPTGDNPIRKLVALEHTYIPFDLPAVSSYISTTGAGTQSATTKLNVSTTAQLRTYTISPTTTIEEGYIVRMSYQAISGGNTSSTVRGMVLRLDDGAAKSYEVEVRISENKIRLYDSIAGATIGSDFSTGNLQRTDILISFFDGEVYAWANKNPVDSPHNFQAIASTQSLTNGGGGGAASSIKWGHLSLGTAQTDFFSFLWSAGTQTGNQLDGSSIFGRPYPIQGKYVYINGGLEISTQDSPTYNGDSWRIERTADYPIKNIFFEQSSSPRVTWRSSAVVSGSVAEQFIPLLMSTTMSSNENTPFGNDLIYLSLMGINFQNWQLQYYNSGTSAWVTLKTFDNGTGLSGTFTRQGAAVVPVGASPQASPFYLFNNELIGATCILDDGAGNRVYREIISNTEGIFDNKIGKRANILLKGALTSDPNTGSMNIIPKNASFVVSLNGVKGAAWGIRITAQETIDNDIRIGSLSMGSVAVFSPQYGRGRSITFEPNVEIYEQPDNTIRTRIRGAGKKIARISWSDGVDLRPFFEDTLDPDFYKSSSTAGALAVANYGDIPYQLQGVYEYLQGSKPIVYFPSIDVSSSLAGDTRTYSRDYQFLYGLTDGSLSYDSVLGDELSDEVFRVATVIIREVV